MTIDDLRAEWERELLRCDATVALIKGLPEVANGILENDPSALVAQEYAERLAGWSAQLREMQARYSGDPRDWAISIQSSGRPL